MPDSATPAATERVASTGDSIRKPTRAHRVRQGSRPLGVANIVVGALSLLVLIPGGVIFLVAQGVGTAASIADGLQSSGFRTICICAMVLGLIAVVLGFGAYRKMSTHVARAQALNGAFLGILGAAGSIAALAFVAGDMGTFSNNFLNFPEVGEWFSYFVTGFVNTLILTGASAAIGLVLGLLIATLLISKQRVLRAPARVYVNVLRGTPTLVEMSLVYFGLALGLGLDLSAGTAIVIALAMSAAAYNAEVFRAGIQSVNRGQTDAARGLGLNYIQTLRFTVIPQAVRSVIPPLMNNFIIVTKESSLIAFIGVSLGGRELFSVALQGYSQFFNSTFFVAAAMGYLVVTLPLIWIVNQTEKRLRSGLAGAIV